MDLIFKIFLPKIFDVTWNRSLIIYGIIFQVKFRRFWTSNGKRVFTGWLWSIGSIWIFNTCPEKYGTLVFIATRSGQTVLIECHWCSVLQPDAEITTRSRFSKFNKAIFENSWLAVWSLSLISVQILLICHRSRYTWPFRSLRRSSTVGLSQVVLLLRLLDQFFQCVK